MNFRLISIALLMSCSISPALAQYDWQNLHEGESENAKPFHNIQYEVEAQGSFSKSTTPLWLNANRYGMSSLEENNGYLRGMVERPMSTDSARRWALGYGLDMAVTSHYESKVFVQQAYVEGRWLHGSLTIGAKQYPMEMKNQRLSSGSQTLGINAHPIPQIRLALPKYWTIPALGRWFHLKGHIAYGIYTDGNWQEDFTHGKSSYTKKILYHSKAGYIMIGKPEAFYPVTFEVGLEMAAQFGGTNYNVLDNGEVIKTDGGHGIKDFFNAFIPGGDDATDGQYRNIEGNQLGSWVARLSYEADSWKGSLYFDHFFEDHSQLFFLDYDGYDAGENYTEKKHHRFTLYPMKDMMLGMELNFKNMRWLKDLVVEYLYTKYQSSGVFHNHTAYIADHVGGVDNYYNHSNYQGWQHWGQVIGNPLYRSPIYNTNGKIYIEDNRFVGWHVGFDGQPAEHFDYRVLASWQRGYGTYANPYTHARHNFSFMVEGAYHFPCGWNARLAYGMDFGSILGHNRGLQFTVSKSGILKR